MIQKKLLSAAIAAAITAAFAVLEGEDGGDEEVASSKKPAGKAAAKPAPAAKGKAKKATVADCVALAKELGATGARPILKAAGFASPKALQEAEDEMEQADIEDLYRDLKAAGSDEEEEEEEDEEEDDEEEDGEELDVDTVKKAVQAYAKENGKDEADEILAEFELTSVRSLNKLKPAQLRELYEAVTE